MSARSCPVIPPGQEDIAKNEVNGLVDQNLIAFGARPRLEDGVAQGLQALERDLTNPVIILDDKDELSVSARKRIPERSGARLAAARAARGDTGRPSSLAGRARKGDETARLLGEVEDAAETEPGAGAELLGRKERLRRALQNLLRHADTGVGERAGRSRLHAHRDRFAASSVKRHIACLDGKLAAPRHRIARIDGEVQYRAVDFAGSVGVGQSSSKIRNERNGAPSVCSRSLIVSATRPLRTRRCGASSRLRAMDSSRRLKVPPIWAASSARRINWRVFSRSICGSASSRFPAMMVASC